MCPQGIYVPGTRSTIPLTSFREDTLGRRKVQLNPLDIVAITLALTEGTEAFPTRLLIEFPTVWNF